MLGFLPAKRFSQHFAADRRGGGAACAAIFDNAGKRKRRMDRRGKTDKPGMSHAVAASVLGAAGLAGD